MFANSSYRQKTVFFILVLALIRVIWSFGLELGNDEAYYWLYSRDLFYNYFDHPPMVAVWIRLFSGNLAGEDFEGFVRLGSVVGCAMAAWFLYQAVRRIHSERAGFFCSLLYQVSFYAGITAGVYAMPDAPQMVFWTFSMWMLANLTQDDESWKWWMFFAAGAGLCIMSKVHGIFLWIGLASYILFLRREWLQKPQLYAAILLTILLISPILIWNLEYDFATYRFHSNRVNVHQFKVEWLSGLREIKNQIGFNNPLNVLLVVAALTAWIRRRFRTPEVLLIYNLIGLPLAILLIFVSFFRTGTLPHWSGPAYVTLLPVAAIYLSERTRSFFPNYLRASVVLFLVCYVSYVTFLQYYPGTYGSKTDTVLGKGDISLDMYGWREAGKEFSQMYQEDVRNGRMPANASLVTPHWWGAHVEYYFARPNGLQMLGIAQPFYLHHYLWLNAERSAQCDINRAYSIIPSDDHYRPPFALYDSVSLAGVIRIRRNGQPAHNFEVYRLSGFRGQLPLARPSNGNP